MADNTQLNTGLGGDIIAADDIGGVKFQRIKLIHGINDVNDGDVAKANPLPVQVINTNRSDVKFHVSAVTPAPTADAMISLSKSVAPGSALTSNTSFAVTTGKRFKMTQIQVAARVTGTPLLQTTTFNFRTAASGTVTTATPVAFALRATTPANAGAVDRINLVLPDDGFELPGDAQFGISAATNVVAASAPSIDVTILGYEY